MGSTTGIALQEKADCLRIVIIRTQQGDGLLRLSARGMSVEGALISSIVRRFGVRVRTLMRSYGCVNPLKCICQPTTI